MHLNFSFYPICAQGTMVTPNMLCSVELINVVVDPTAVVTKKKGKDLGGHGVYG